MIGLILTAFAGVVLGYSLGWFSRDLAQVRQSPYDAVALPSGPPMPSRPPQEPPVSLSELFAVPEQQAQG